MSDLYSALTIIVVTEHSAVKSGKPDLESHHTEVFDFMLMFQSFSFRRQHQDGDKHTLRTEPYYIIFKPQHNLYLVNPREGRINTMKIKKM